MRLLIIYNGTYSVYVHHFPNGKVYVGITSASPEHRWQPNGKGYQSQPKIWNAIQKYGWENIEHEIFASRLTAEEASKTEILLIKLYNSVDKNNGYNVSDGGIDNYKYFKYESEILDMWKQGMWTAKIAKEIGCDARNVKYILRLHNVTDKDFKNRETEARHKVQMELIQKRNYNRNSFILELWNSGWTVMQISAIVDVNRHIVQRTLKNNGISLKDREYRKYDGMRASQNYSKNRVIQYSLDGTVINIWTSAHEAAKYLGYRFSNICRSCRNNKTYKNFIWKYERKRNELVENKTKTYT